jgi:hypothetical protein
MLVRASCAVAALAIVVGVGWGCGGGTNTNNSSSGGGTPGTGGAGQGGQGTGATTTANGGAGQGGSAGTTTPSSGGNGPGSGGSSANGGGGPGSGGTTNPGSGGGGGGTMTCSNFGDPCTVCLSQNCVQTYCTCHNDVNCVQLALCFQQCAPNDNACYQACDTAHSSGIAPFYIVENCGASACTAQCAGAVTLTPCQVCSFTNCASEADACLADAGCHAISDCISNCNDDTCRAACLNGHTQSSQNKANALTQCALSMCPGTCP